MRQTADIDQKTDIQIHELIQTNSNFINEFGIESFFSKNGIPSQFADMIVSLSGTDVDYEKLANQYQFNAETARTFFMIYEVEKVVSKQLESYSSLQVRSCFGCAVAVAGSIVVTASAVTIGSAGTAGAGAALGFWVASKVIATIGIIDSCKDCNDE